MILFETKIHRKYRKKCLVFLGSSFADLLALCMFPLYIINPTGIQFYIWKILWEELKRQLSYEKIADHDEDDEHEHLSIIFGEAIVTIYKLPMSLITMVVCLIVPSVWHAGWHGFAHYRQKKNAAYAASSTIGKYYDIYDSEWEFTMNLLYHAIIDFWVGPFALFAYMSPLRHASMTSLMERVNAEQNTSYTLLPHDWNYKYSLWYRKKVVKYGALAVAGVICLIHIYIFYIMSASYCTHILMSTCILIQLLTMVDLLVSTITLLPIWLTQYRWAPIRAIILKDKKGFKELSTIVIYAALLGMCAYMYVFMYTDIF